MLHWPLYITFAGLLLVWAVPARAAARGARVVALGVALAGLVCGWVGALRLEPQAGLVTLVNGAWVPWPAFRFHLAADGITVVLVLLTGLAAVAGVLFSWNIEHRAREYYSFYLALIGGVYGVFLSMDLFLLFVFYELAIVPKYFLIALWGSTRKEYGAMKLALYSFVGSAMVLVALLATYVVSGIGAAGGPVSFDLPALAKVAFPVSFQQWVFPLMFVGFAILAGLWPFHSWAPTGHVAAPTAASMLLAGVIMKLGAYGALRVAMTLFPQGLVEWQMPLAWLAVAGIVYGALAALVQNDFKFVIGYSSVSHMGFVMLGLVTLTTVGLHGAVLQMFSHGIIAGLLFGVVGRMVYDRAHTRELEALEGLRLARALPFAAVTFVVAGAASMGLPGFSGFVAELQVLIGAWQAFPGLTLLAGVGVMVGVAYTWRTMHRAFFSDRDAAPVALPGPLPPITWPEKAGAALLMLCTLAVGLYPRLLLDWIIPAFNSPMFEGLRKVVTR
ncbi:NADH-quinone oxidoreductase subunit M [Fontisphaera persica]|uniref:complex I subunit 4 family protein n=1 Tax=Fontisphaera persica TaxID=2974023 RepID=UPI0024C0140C|nr:NADH-quinone oxidoreductase subunit M [Fontisphaera persica]WCJ59296.1 NADH-quinone oxidoreductase subunit M [Fontisphaera persica]